MRKTNFEHLFYFVKREFTELNNPVNPLDFSYISRKKVSQSGPTIQIRLNKITDSSKV